MPDLELNKIHLGDILDILPTLPGCCVNTVVTSPPYFALRDYGLGKSVWPEITYTLFGMPITVPAMECCLGLEKDPKEFIGHMVHVFRLVHRVLRNDGTLWLNMGDSYANNTTPGGGDPTIGKRNLGEGKSYNKKTIPKGLKNKDMIGIPWMLAFALRDDGWYLRQDIIWAKPNPMPESAGDRCTKAHEYIFLLSKSSRYYYDAFAIKTPYADNSYTTFGIEHKHANGDGSGLVASENWSNRIKERKPKVWKTSDGWDTEAGSHSSVHRTGRSKGQSAKDKLRGHEREHKGFNEKWHNMTREEQQSEGANKRSVWNVPIFPFKEAHFATYPPALIVDCIKAGAPPGGIVLDPFMGAGTTGLVAIEQNRKFIGIEKSPQSKHIADRRINNAVGLFLNIA